MDFFLALVRYEVTLWNALEARLRGSGGLSLAQLQTLEIVDRSDRTARVYDIAAAIGITVGAASKLTDRLERDGLVARRPNPDDRRSSLVSLTTNGSAALRGARTVVADFLAAALDADDVDAAGAAIGRLSVRLDSVLGAGQPA
ncbi:MarR family transcriptional regulator [Microbacterium sp. RD1]|uniref:MarR family transcriptional regulator n=1 Tax=Microbacterium sp. RD1 TaxID=3457313 RepID=UPI003FA598A7